MSSPHGAAAQPTTQQTTQTSGPHSVVAPKAAGPGDPYLAMLRGGAVPALVVSAVAVVVFTLREGRLGLAGGALAVGVVVLTFASSTVLLRRVAALDPRIVFMAAMVGYTTKVGLLGLLLLLFGDAAWLSPIAFALTAIVASLAWTTGEVVAFTRVRTLIYDPSAEDGGAPRP